MWHGLGVWRIRAALQQPTFTQAVPTSWMLPGLGSEQDIAGKGTSAIYIGLIYFTRLAYQRAHLRDRLRTLGSLHIDVLWACADSTIIVVPALLGAFGVQVLDIDEHPPLTTHGAEFFLALSKIEWWHVARLAAAGITLGLFVFGRATKNKPWKPCAFTTFVDGSVLISLFLRGALSLYVIFCGIVLFGPLVFDVLGELRIGGPLVPEPVRLKE